MGTDTDVTAAVARDRAGWAPTGGDVALAVAAALLGAVMAYLGSSALGYPRPLVPAAVAIGEALPLLWRRRAPVTVLAASLLVFLTGAAVTDVTPAPMLGTLLAAYTIGAVHDRRVAITVAVTASLAAPLLAVGVLDAPFPWTISVTGEGFHLLDAILGAMFGLWGATLIGAYVGTRRAYVAGLADRAARLEREREERAERAVVQERSRIARELHDVAAHHLSGITLQAAALQRTLDPEHGPARTMVDDIRTESATALAAMRRLIDVLREDDTDGRAPQPCLDELDDLIARARSSGLEVDVAVDGEVGTDALPQGLPREVELAAYRIVQEALTNVRRHAPGATAWVGLRHAEGQLTVEVSDDGGTAPRGEHVEPGHGLLGMRERATLLGGCMEAGPRRDGPGWRVRTQLPTGQEVSR